MKDQGRRPRNAYQVRAKVHRPQTLPRQAANVRIPAAITTAVKDASFCEYSQWISSITMTFSTTFNGAYRATSRRFVRSRDAGLTARAISAVRVNAACRANMPAGSQSSAVFSRGARGHSWRGAPSSRPKSQKSNAPEPTAREVIIAITIDIPNFFSTARGRLSFRRGAVSTHVLDTGTDRSHVASTAHTNNKEKPFTATTIAKPVTTTLKPNKKKVPWLAP